jgi:hypothetical protein
MPKESFHRWETSGAFWLERSRNQLAIPAQQSLDAREYARKTAPDTPVYYIAKGKLRQ